MASSKGHLRGNVNLSPETARKLFDNGGVLVLLNLPVGSVFGIDMKVFNVGEKFRGIKMIPPGLHFIYYSVVSKDGVIGPRTGFFHYFKRQDIVYKKYDKKEEEISSDIPSEEELERIKHGLKDLDPYLGAYPYQALKNWNRLVCNINEPLLHKLQPLNQVINSVTHFLPLPYPPPPSTATAGSSSRSSHQTLEEKYLPDMKPIPGTELRFTNIPNIKYPDGSSAAEITKHSLDSTYVLQQLLQTYDNEEDILGELQFSLVCFLIAHVYDAFEHWKKVLEVLCAVDSGLSKYTELYRTFIVILHYQIKEIPTDFFTDITCDSNFLVTTLRMLFENVRNSNTCDEFKKFVVDFQKNITKTYKWDFDSIPDDEMPTIVDV